MSDLHLRISWALAAEATDAAAGPLGPSADDPDRRPVFVTAVEGPAGRMHPTSRRASTTVADLTVFRPVGPEFDDCA